MKLLSNEKRILSITRLSDNFIFNCCLAGGWLILVLVSHGIRPMFFSNEILYTTVAWETWQHHHFILPVLEGHLYAEKGPLLFWLIQAGWTVFGVSEWWVRFLHELFGLALLLLVRKLAQLLWPDNKNLPNLAALILLGAFWFLLKVFIFRFDIPSAFFAILATIFLISATHRHKIYWLYFSIVITLGLLTKGPVLFLFILPGAVLMKVWASPIYSWKKVYLYLTASILCSLLLAALWLAAAIFQAGGHYAYNLLVHGLLARVWNIHTHKNPWWKQNWIYYEYKLLLMLLPWAAWGAFWQSGRQFIKNWRDDIQSDKKIRLLLITIISAIILLTFVTEKAPRYIVPLLPYVAIFIAYILDKYAEGIKKIQPKILAIGYIAGGIVYAALPFASHLTALHKFPWMKNISPVWGLVVILMGIFFLFWKPRSLHKAVTALSISTLLLWSCINFGLVKAESDFFNWQSFGAQIAQLQSEGYPLATLGSLPELQFFARTSQPFLVLNQDEVEQWAKQHPGGRLIVRNPETSPKSLYLQPAN